MSHFGGKKGSPWQAPAGINTARPALHIAKECGVHVGTVLAWMRRNSLPVGPRGSPIGTKWAHPKAGRLDPASLDWTRQDVALGKAHGVCRERIRQLRKAAGLPASGSAEWLAAGGVVTNPSKKNRQALDRPPGLVNNGITK
jgi:hypothetical protein